MLESNQSYFTTDIHEPIFFEKVKLHRLWSLSSASTEQISVMLRIMFDNPTSVAVWSQTFGMRDKH